MQRYSLLDLIRALAIVLMVIFHFSYDLSNFGLVQIDFQNDSFWYAFPRVIVFLFMLAAGSALTLGHAVQIRWPAFWKRFAKIALGAVVISVSTYVMFPERWIYFGTLHSIAICSLIALPFLRYPRVSLIVGILLTLPHLYLGHSIPWFTLPHRSMDYIPPFPWVGVMLFGVALAHWVLPRLGNPKLGSIGPFIQFLSKHSLKIYLLHQPTLWGLVYLFWKIAKTSH
jgi:uncharacterized membrane protein